MTRRRPAAAQINFGSLVCSILLSLRNRLPPFVAGIINALLAQFGCLAPPPPTTTTTTTTTSP